MEKIVKKTTIVITIFLYYKKIFTFCRVLVARFTAFFMRPVKNAKEISISIFTIAIFGRFGRLFFGHLNWNIFFLLIF